MSFLDKLQSKKSALRLTILCTFLCGALLGAFACFAFFHCQNTECKLFANISEEQIETQSEAQANTEDGNENETAQPAEEMEITLEEDLLNETEDDYFASTDPSSTSPIDENGFEVTENTYIEMVNSKVEVNEPAKETPVAPAPVAATQTQVEVVEKPEKPASTEKPTNTVKPTAKPSSTQKKTTAPPRNAKDRITEPGLLPTPMWIVLIANSTNEAEAIQLSSQYWALGYKSNYFWSPDYEDTNELVFKIFLGPFANKELAEQFVNEKNDPNLQVIYLQ